MLFSPAKEAHHEPAWSIPAYSGCHLAVSGCTPMLQLYEDGTIAWKGCPTWTCIDIEDECQGQFSGEDLIGRCNCLRDGWEGVFCEGIVVFDPSGIPVSWDCISQQCGQDCVKQPTPPAPGTFPVCMC